MISCSIKTSCHDGHVISQSPRTSLLDTQQGESLLSEQPANRSHEPPNSWLFTSTNTGDSSYQVNVLLKNEHYGLLQPGAGISNVAALSRRMSTESGVELLNSIPGSEMNSFCGQITSHPCLFPHRKSNTCLAMVV